MDQDQNTGHQQQGYEVLQYAEAAVKNSSRSVTGFVKGPVKHTLIVGMLKITVFESVEFVVDEPIKKIGDGIGLLFAYQYADGSRKGVDKKHAAGCQQNNFQPLKITSPRLHHSQGLNFIDQELDQVKQQKRQHPPHQNKEGIPQGPPR